MGVWWGSLRWKADSDDRRPIHLMIPHTDSDDSTDLEVGHAGAGGGGHGRGEVHEHGGGLGVELLLAHLGLPRQNGRARVLGGLMVGFWGVGGE